VRLTQPTVAGASVPPTPDGTLSASVTR